METVTVQKTLKTFPVFRICVQIGKHWKPFRCSRRGQEKTKIILMFRTCMQTRIYTKTILMFRTCVQTRKNLNLSHIQNLCADQKTLKPFSYSGPECRPENTVNLSGMQNLCEDQKTRKSFLYSGSPWRPENTKTFLMFRTCVQTRKPWKPFLNSPHSSSSTFSCLPSS